MANPNDRPPGRPALKPPERPAARPDDAEARAQIDLFARPAPRGPASLVGRVVSVTDLTRELKLTLESRFSRVSVRGEVSNLRPAGSGHLYFTLKDDGACLSAVMFRTDALRLRFPMKDGMLLVARGRLAVFEPRGAYQLVCDSLEPEGAGRLALAFEALKQKLSREGLFQESRKRPIPFLARRIGVVTSPSGAAIRDFLRVLHDRFPMAVVVAAARVQGEGAAAEIARGIERLARSGLVDVIVVTRGGGSIEDLWAFNEEIVARAIAACPVPVISAVGHEVDFTIADFVADKRCATPTDAAKCLAPAKVDLARALEKHRRHLAEILKKQLSLRRERLSHRRARLADPRMEIGNQRLRLDHQGERMRRALARRVGSDRLALRGQHDRLDRGHPRARLARLSRDLTGLAKRLEEGSRRRLSDERSKLERLEKGLARGSPLPNLAREHRRLSLLRERAEKALKRRLTERHLQLSRAAGALQSLSPLQVLGRGYSVAFKGERRVLMTAHGLAPGDTITVMLPDRSEVEAAVSATREPPKDEG